MISIILSIVSLIMLVSPIPIMVLTFRGRFEFLHGIFLSASAVLISFISAIASVNKEIGQNIIDVSIRENFEQIKQTFETIPTEQLQKMLGNVTAEQALSYRGDVFNMLNNLQGIYIMFFPAITILSILAFIFCGFMIVKLILGLFKFDVSRFPLFSEFKISKATITAFLVSLICSYISTVPTITAAFLNIVVIIMGTMAVCGFSLFDFKVRQKIDNSWARMLIYIAIITLVLSISPSLIYLYIFVAMIDSFYDFRKLNFKEGQNG